MEKTSNEFISRSNFPIEIQRHIADYLDASGLGFFAQSNKQILKNILPLLRNYQAMSPLQLTSKGSSTYLYQANQLFVCGSNYDGQLGIISKKNQFIFTDVIWLAEQGRIHQAFAGLEHFAVLTEDNQLWICGNNEYGQRGLIESSQFKSKGKAMPSSFTVVPWPAERDKIQRICTGGHYTLVLTQNNELWACGNNEYGQLGLGMITDYSSFTNVFWPKERGRIEQVIAGIFHTIVLTQDSQLWVCGDNSHGQLGLGDEEYHVPDFTAVLWPKERGKIQKVIASGNHTMVLTEHNQLWVCGNNEYGQLGLGDNAYPFIFTQVVWPEERGKIQQVIAGGNHTMVLTEHNQLWVCGNNKYGQLGLGDKEARSTFTNVFWSKERGNIQQVIAGSEHTIVLTQANVLWVCGDNSHGQLGLGDEENSSILTPVKMLPKAMQQILTINKHLNQLIKLGTRLTSMPDPVPAPSILRRNQHQPDEPEGQPPLKKMRL